MEQKEEGNTNETERRNIERRRKEKRRRRLEDSITGCNGFKGLVLVMLAAAALSLSSARICVNLI